MKDQSQLAGILADRPIMEEFQRKAADPRRIYAVRGLAVPSQDEGEVLEGPRLELEGAPAPEGPRPPSPSELEAIVDLGRPVLLIRRDTFEVPESDEWKDRLYPTRSKLEYAIRAVGRVELEDHDSFRWVGTAWMVTEDVAVTNRHVADFFSRPQGSRIVFRSNMAGMTIRARLDYKVEYKINATREIEVEKILYMSENREDVPDIALLKLRKSSGFQLPAPLILSDDTPEEGAFVVAIGYPMRDSRSTASYRRSVFGDIYDVKRLSPGTILGYGEEYYFTHDCSTLGGSSGSVIIDVTTGEALGLHFGGTELTANYAVKASVLRKVLRDNNVTLPTSPLGVGREAVIMVEEGPPLTPAAYADRKGYDPTFLRTSTSARTQVVPFPTMPDELRDKAVRVRNGNNDGDGDGDGDGEGSNLSRYELKYNHFSLVMNGERRMAFFTAVNIDGRALRRIPRSNDRWLIDPRIPKSSQAGEELYRNNDLDRGHLVRRLDPVWGSVDEASRANNDTFHYANAAPQHKDLNQKTWNDLEDYILDNAGARNLKVTVFTGPVFTEEDPEYRSFRLPTQFWKVVVLVKSENRRLSATAYILSQRDMLSDLEFAFGQFRTYQVLVTQIEGLTNLDFGTLRDFDPLARIEAFPIRLINRAEDIVI